MNSEWQGSLTIVDNLIVTESLIIVLCSEHVGKSISPNKLSREVENARVNNKKKKQVRKS